MTAPSGFSQSTGLRYGSLSKEAVHLCIDMQRLFREDTPWRTPWMDVVTPRIVEICAAQPASTVFTRFIPPRRPDEAAGAWARYWTKWQELTLERIDPSLIELIDELAAFCPPARVINKHVYSPWSFAGLDAALRERECTTLIVSGTETDICVLATVAGAVDRGYRVIVVADAVCGSSDITHDAALAIYSQRLETQIETVTTAELLANWR
jgi:nicotinamidase-related amidase